MPRTAPLSVPLIPFLALLALLPVATAQDGKPPAPAPAAATEKAKQVFEKGEAQVVDAFKDRKKWIREWMFVEAPFDSDKDGRPDRLHVDVTRPEQTKTEGLKVPVVYETSPYFAGTGPMDLGYYWDVKQELGEASPKRAEMAPIGFGKEPGMISQSEVQRWLQRGFAVVHSCSPGTGWSQGCPSIGGPNEAQAPQAVIDWLCGRRKAFKTLDGKDEVKADWCSGKVGMIGTSYNGTLPVAAATTGVQGLAAIVPIAPATSWYLYYRSNGLVRSPGGYLGEDMDVLFDFVASGDPKRRGWCIENVRDGELAKGLDRAHGDYNDFWAARDYLNQLDKYTCPTLMAHGFNDWNVMPENSVKVYAALKQKGVPCMAFFHQAGHGGEPPFPLINRWFSRFLCDVQNGVEKEPKAWIVREGDKMNAPTQYADYPHPDSQLVAVHPHGDGRGIGELVLAKKPGQGIGVVIDDVGQKGGNLAQVEHSENRLLFATATLTQPLHLSGTAHIKLAVAADKPAVNLSVWIVSLPWTGARKATDDIITRGWADPQNAKSLRQSEPLEPGKFRDLEFDLQPDDQVIAAGERIGLMVFASDHEFTLWPKPGTKLSVDLDALVLTLPVVGGEAAWKAAFAPAAPDAKR